MLNEATDLLGPHYGLVLQKRRGLYATKGKIQLERKGQERLFRRAGPALNQLGSPACPLKPPDSRCLGKKSHELIGRCNWIELKGALAKRGGYPSRARRGRRPPSET